FIKVEIRNCWQWCWKKQRKCRWQILFPNISGNQWEWNTMPFGKSITLKMASKKLIAALQAMREISPSSANCIYKTECGTDSRFCLSVSFLNRSIRVLKKVRNTVMVGGFRIIKTTKFIICADIWGSL